MPDDLDRDFATAIRRAGLTIPAERWAVMREAFDNMQTLLKILDERLAYADEPAVLPLLDPGARR